MKHKGVWAALIVLLLLFGLCNSYLGRFKRPDLADACIELKSSLETIKVDPGRITMEKALLQPQNPMSSDAPDMPSDGSNNQPETLEADLSETDGNMDEPRPLILLTFNIRSANDAKGSVEMEKIIEEIQETDADIIGLQEVERMMPRSGYKDQAKLIAEQLGYHYYYGENINILGIQYGNALLSKYPILEASNHKLPKEKLEPRGMIEADIDIDGSLWYVYVTHLGLNSMERNKQVDYINGILSKREGNIILMGDFNNRPDSEEMSMLNDRMADSAAALNRTDQFTFAWKDVSPNVRIDRIYASDNIELYHHEVRPSMVSDHKRVLTQILVNILPKEGIQQEAANKVR